MEAETQTTVKVCLHLTESEAKWLKDYMQTTKTGGSESDEDTANRLSLFQVLSTSLR